MSGTPSPKVLEGIRLSFCRRTGHRPGPGCSRNASARAAFLSEPVDSDQKIAIFTSMFCKRKYIVDPKNREHVRRVNHLVLRKKFRFVVGEGGDALRGWCSDVRLENSAFLVLVGVILDVTTSRRQREYQEHSELRFLNAPFAAFINERDNGEGVAAEG